VGLTQSCRTAVSQRIDCHPLYRQWQLPTYHGTFGNLNLTNALCDEGCRKSLAGWFETVERYAPARISLAHFQPF
jgi:hypothetical protein